MIIELTGLLNSSNISFILVFMEGVISFFSPCVIPLIPIYIGFLAGNAKEINEDGIAIYERKRVFLHTFFFVVGISFAFFILGMSFSALGQFFNHNKVLFTRIGGIIIILMGLVQLGFFDLGFLQKERRFHINLYEKEVNPFIALVLGFTFSFSWTPCIGPALSSVLILASGAKAPELGYLLVFIYTLGFVIPFLLLGLFTSQVLTFLKSRQRFLKYTIKTGGIILLLIGIMTFTGWMNGVSSYLNSLGNYFYDENSTSINKDTNNDTEDTANSTQENSIEDNKEMDSEENTDEAEETGKAVVPAFDFTLTDQYGNEHTLSDYKGKVVFLNFWATWCPPCKQEIPHIDEIYKEYNSNKDEVVILGITNPKTDEYPQNADEKKEDIISFLDENQYTFPTVFDETGEVFDKYYINAFPTTFMIDKEGNVYGYAPGMLTKEMMKSIIEETIKSTEP